MTLFFTLLPLYLFGNVHCLGMCGPLVMMIGQHRYRYWYFIGRLISFALAGAIAGEAGAVLHIFLKQYHLSELISFIFGGFILWIGLKSLLRWQTPKIGWLSRPLTVVNQTLSQLMLRDTGWSTFLFGFFTVALPCGQTLVVFSACALAGDIGVGLFNGLALALLTTPSLALAMHTHHVFKRFKKHYQTVLGASSILIGILALCRGLAEIGWISHWVLNPGAPSYYHIVIF
jgi:sulfite exporter TauE/SafE